MGLVSYSFLPRIGGCARLAIQLARGLPELGWDVRVVAPLHGDPPDLGEGWPPQVPVHWARSRVARGYEDHRSRAALMGSMTRVIRGLADEVDVWLALDFQVGTLAGVAGARGRPVVAVFGANPLYELLFFHAEAMPPRPELSLPVRAGLTVAETALRRAYGRLRGVVTFAEESVPYARAYTPAPATVIPMAVDVGGAPGSRSTTPHLLAVARLVPWKGVEDVIEMAATLRGRFDDLVLTVCGDGPLAETLEARHRDSPWLRLALRVPFDGMRSHYETAWALVHPSRYETFGLVVVEAMAHGLPVVASDVGPIPELVDHGRTGFVLPRTDRAAWIDTLSGLLSRPRRVDEMGRAARDAVLERFTVERMTERYDRMLRGHLR